ncbi:MAG: hypothetical protein ABFD92_03645 [Planctomycetaceae bacterium]|nr:hypothetical protein [Planctomycetaceae bacterium]
MMSRRSIMIMLAAVVVLAAAGAGRAAEAPLQVVFFMSPTCDHCMKVKRHLPDILKQFGSRVEVHERDLGGQLLLWEEMRVYAEHYKVEVKAPPAVFVGTRAMVGEEDILKSLEAAISQALAGGEVTFMPGASPVGTAASGPASGAAPVAAAASQSMIERFKSLGVGAIIVAGLVDGINPCAFTTIIFFLSMLGYLRKSKRDIIMVGVGFTAAIFVTYLALGLVLMQALIEFKARVVGAGGPMILGLVVAALVFALSAWSLVDVIRYKRSGDVRSMKLGLPKGIKQRIHKVIREGLTSRRLFIGSVVVGFIVAVLESICTGQTYAPVLYVIQELPSLRAQALPYLLLYNIMFILPLVVILFLGYKGVTSERLGDFMHRHLVGMKLGMAALFAALGAVVLMTVWMMR